MPKIHLQIQLTFLATTSFSAAVPVPMSLDATVPGSMVVAVQAHMVAVHVGDNIVLHVHKSINSALQQSSPGPPYIIPPCQITEEALATNNRQLWPWWGVIMWVPLPTTMAKYFHHSPMMLPKDTMEAPVNSRLHLLQPRQAKRSDPWPRGLSKSPNTVQPLGQKLHGLYGLPQGRPVAPHLPGVHLAWYLCPGAN